MKHHLVPSGSDRRAHKDTADVETPSKEAKSVRYFMVRADALRKTTRSTLPALQSLLEDPGTKDWIVETQMNFDDACRGVYRDEYLAVSHRWIVEGTREPKRAPPDPDGVQLKSIQTYLQQKSQSLVR